MMPKMQYISAAIFLIIMVSAGAISVSGKWIHPDLSVCAFIAFTVLVHVFVVLSRKDRKQLAGVLARESFSTIPDMTVLLILANYALAIVILQPLTDGWEIAIALSGLTITAAVLLLHWLMGVLATKPTVEKMVKISADFPRQDRASAVVKQLCLRLREAVALASALSLVLLAEIGVNLLMILVTDMIAGLAGALIIGIRLAKSVSATTRARSDSTIDTYFEQLQPQYILHYSAPKEKSSATLLMQLHRLKELGYPFTIVLREENHFNAVVKAGFDNVVHVRAMADLERQLHASIKLAVYIADSAKNVQLIRFSHLTHVLISTTENVTSALGVYDKVAVSSIELAKKITEAGIMPAEHVILLQEEVAHTIDTPLANRKLRILTIAYLLGPTNGDWAIAAHTCRNVAQAVREYGRPAQLLISAELKEKEGRTGTAVVLGMQRAFRQPQQGNGVEFYTNKEMSFDIASRQADVLIMDEPSVTRARLLRGHPIILTPARFRSSAESPWAASLDGACYRLNTDFSNLADLLDLVVEEDFLWDARRRLADEMNAGWRPLTLQAAFAEFSLEMSTS